MTKLAVHWTLKKDRSSSVFYLWIATKSIVNHVDIYMFYPSKVMVFSLCFHEELIYGIIWNLRVWFKSQKILISLITLFLIFLPKLNTVVGANITNNY